MTTKTQATQPVAKTTRTRATKAAQPKQQPKAAPAKAAPAKAEQKVEPLSATGERLVKWGLTPRVARQDAAVLDLLSSSGPLTEAAVTEKLGSVSSWTFRRLATGQHRGEQVGEPLIERVKVDGAAAWKVA